MRTEHSVMGRYNSNCRINILGQVKAIRVGCKSFTVKDARTILGALMSYTVPEGGRKVTDMAACGVRDGQFFHAMVYGMPMFGMVRIMNGEYYLCQNVMCNKQTPIPLEYRYNFAYSWDARGGSAYWLRVHSIHDLIVYDDNVVRDKMLFASMHFRTELGHTISVHPGVILCGGSPMTNDNIREGCTRLGIYDKLMKTKTRKI